MTTEAYPLSWPHGWPRIDGQKRKRASFGTGERVKSYVSDHSYMTRKQVTIAEGIKRVLVELERLGVEHGEAIISSNLVLRLDGLPRSGQGEPSDPGVAVYWSMRDEPMKVMAIDRYDRVADNLAAVAATLSAMRAIERHGGGQILERAFTGFTALSGPDALDPFAVLGLRAGASRDDVQAKFRTLAKDKHPDAGGSQTDFQTIQWARDEALRRLGA